MAQGYILAGRPSNGSCESAKVCCLQLMESLPLYTQAPAVPAEQPPSRPTQAPRITPADTSRRSLKALKRIASFYVRSLAERCSRP